MITAQENELLTQVGPGTPMGRMLRRYWMPALLSEELPEPDGTPVEVQLLGENLVAFRDSAGRVGLLERQCPHRGSSLAYGRNEEGGLRCIYHGWKFDVDGRCLELPTEPEDGKFRATQRACAYATHEAGGVVWAYLGPKEAMPEFPRFLWLQLWPKQSKEWKVLEECNFVQAVEGGIDSAHVGFLHRRDSSMKHNLNSRDTAPKLQMEYTSYGFRYAALRNIGDGKQYVRITPYIAPWTTVVPPGNLGHESDGTRVANLWIPRDDYTTWHYQYLFNPLGPIDVEARVEEAGLCLDVNYRKLRNANNRYLQDREEMRSGENYSGIRGIVTEDHAANESQGRILDRTREHLGPSDLAVIAMRHVLLTGVEAHEKEADPPGLALDIPIESISSEAAIIESGQAWQDVCPVGTVASGLQPGLNPDQPNYPVEDMDT